MTTESNPIERERRTQKVIRQGGPSGAFYGMGLIGAWVYYLSHATTIWMGIVGFFKGIFWPAFLVYEWMKFLGM